MSIKSSEFSNLSQIILIITQIEIDVSINSPELNSSSIIGSNIENPKSVDEQRNILKIKKTVDRFMNPNL